MKRQYIKPIMQEYDLDKEISLVLMTSETEIPDDPRRSAAQSPEGGNTFEENPFEESSLK